MERYCNSEDMVKDEVIVLEAASDDFRKMLRYGYVMEGSGSW